MAKNIYNFFYDGNYWDEPEFEPEEPYRAIANPNNNHLEPVLPIKVYPNPADQRIIFKIEKNDYQNISIEAYDIAGRMVFSKETDSNIYEMNVENLPDGIYIYRVIANSINLGFGKFIIKH